MTGQEREGFFRMFMDAIPLPLAGGVALADLMVVPDGKTIPMVYTSTEGVVTDAGEDVHDAQDAASCVGTRLS